jgi:4-hydroxy-L-threonine phosphate dehydrogenase PdxA
MNIHQSILPTIALVPGDCTGIGPEQTARILADGNLAEVAHLVVVGDARVLEMGMVHAGVRLEIERVASPRQASRKRGVVPLVDLGNTDPSLFPLGTASAESGRLTGETLSRTIDLAKAGEVDAITFAPLNKRAMFDGGWKFPDEHKMFANLLRHRG